MLSFFKLFFTGLSVMTVTPAISLVAANHNSNSKISNLGNLSKVQKSFNYKKLNNSLDPKNGKNWESITLKYINENKFDPGTQASNLLLDREPINTIKSKDNKTVIWVYKGTDSWQDSKRIVSSKIEYTYETKEARVLNASMPLVTEKGNSLYGEIFGSITTYISNKFKIHCGDIEDNIIIDRQTTENNVVTLMAEGDADTGNFPTIPTHYVINMTYSYLTTDYNVKDINVIQNDRMLLSYDNIKLTVKTAMETQKNTMKDFTILNFTPAQNQTRAFVNVIGELTQGTKSVLVFTNTVYLNTDKTYAVENIKLIDIYKVFVTPHQTGPFYKALDTKVRQQYPKTDSFAIDTVGTVTFSDYNNYYESTAKITIIITFNDKTTLKVMADVAYKFNYNEYIIGDFK